MLRHTMTELCEWDKVELVDAVQTLETELEEHAQVGDGAQWIAVEGLLPPMSAGLVAVVVQRPDCERSIDLARYDRKDGYWRNQWGGSFWGYVTHWMPLPALP